MEAVFLHEQILIGPFHSSQEQVHLKIRKIQKIIEQGKKKKKKKKKEDEEEERNNGRH